jgi:hypothetical protein
MNTNAIINSDRTRKNIVAVDEVTARSPECPIDIAETDIFVENAPEIPEGMFLPKLLEDGSEWIEADPNAASKQKAIDDAKANAIIQKELKEIDADSVRSIREWIVSQPNPPAFLVEHEAAAVAKRGQFK